VDGSNPLGFFAALGLIRLIPKARIGFSNDGAYQAFLETPSMVESDIVKFIHADAVAGESESAPWRFTYIKGATKKRGPEMVADLKAPPDVFRGFLVASIKSWLVGDTEGVGYGAAYATDCAVDGKGNTKPTAFHFTAAHQTFLGNAESIRESLTEDWIAMSLFRGAGERSGKNLRWNPGAERNWALLAKDPSGDETRVDAPLEWLAFRGLPLLPSFPRGVRIMTTGVVGRHDDMTFSWPLWSMPASLSTTRSLVQVDWGENIIERASRGIFALCTAGIRRSKQGFGNFTPAAVVT
jgi:hypothetical protein